VIRLAIVALMALGAEAAAAPKVAAVVGPEGDADVRTAVLVGPSGQVYAGDGKGRWVRTLPGGIAADVTGAARVGTDLVVTGISTPMYRFDGSGWSAERVGQNGKTVLGRGPLAAVAVGKHVFVQNKGKWLRVGSAPGPVTALWASSTKKVFAVTAAGVHALRGSDFQRTRGPVTAIVGASPWGISADGVVDVGSGRSVSAATGIVAAAGGEGAPWLVTSDGASPLALVHKTVRVDTPIPAGTAVAGLAADKAGNVVIVTAAGDVHVRTGDAWSTGTLADELPPAKPGPGPATTK
jgi:hypothetical protein